MKIVGAMLLVVLGLYLFLRFRPATVAPDIAGAPWNLDHERISAMSDEEIEWEIVERVVERMGGDYEPAVVLSLPEGVRAVYATWEVESEVNNGGFDQYFGNTDGALAGEAIAGYRQFGTPRFASLVEEAVAARDDPDALSRLDDQFYELDEPVQDLRIRFIRDNPLSF